MARDRRQIFHNIFPGQKALEDSPKVRRLQFMKARFNKPKCDCGVVAHYKLNDSYWCRNHLPKRLQERLDMDYQMLKIILPYAFYLDGSN